MDSKMYGCRKAKACQAFVLFSLCSSRYLLSLYLSGPNVPFRSPRPVQFPKWWPDFYNHWYCLHGGSVVFGSSRWAFSSKVDVESQDWGRRLCDPGRAGNSNLLRSCTLRHAQANLVDDCRARDRAALPYATLINTRQPRRNLADIITVAHYGIARDSTALVPRNTVAIAKVSILRPACRLHNFEYDINRGPRCNWQVRLPTLRPYPLQRPRFLCYIAVYSPLEFSGFESAGGSILSWL